MRIFVAHSNYKLHICRRQIILVGQPKVLYHGLTGEWPKIDADARMLHKPFLLRTLLNDDTLHNTSCRCQLVFCKFFLAAKLFDMVCRESDPNKRVPECCIQIRRCQQYEYDLHKQVPRNSSFTTTIPANYPRQLGQVGAILDTKGRQCEQCGMKCA